MAVRRVAADDFTRWLRPGTPTKVTRSPVCDQLAQRLLAHQVHALGWLDGKFSVYVREDGTASVSDDLSAGCALIHWPAPDATADYESSERTAFYWTVANLSRREVLNRPGTDAPFLTALPWPQRDATVARCAALGGDFVYLSGRTWVSFEGRPLNGPSGSRLGNEVSRILGWPPWLAHGRWAIDPSGNVSVPSIWPWCDPVRLLAALDGCNDGCAASK
jgi:hypothetical protein